MPCLELSTALLPAISFALNHYSKDIPSRYAKIAAFMASYCEHHPTHKSDQWRSKVSTQPEYIIYKKYYLIDIFNNINVSK